MSRIPFKVSARAGKLLGRENFSNPEGAIIELVKNSYDADAGICIVIFDIASDENSQKPLKKGSSIYIIDNGEGMTEEVIKNYWMQIGTGNKENNYISPNKRVKTGAKGIGRFALDRLGFKTEMWTVPEGDVENGYYWEMDWAQFDATSKSISEIEAELSIIRNLDLNAIIKKSSQEFNANKFPTNIKFNAGTILKITDLKDEWYDDNTGNIKDVFKSLEALVPPKDLNIPFDVFFLHNQQLDEYGKVETAYFNDYDYKVKAKYDAENMKVNIELQRNELDTKNIKKNFPNALNSAKPPYDLQTLNRGQYAYTKPIDKILKWKLDEKNKSALKSVGSFELTFYYLKLSNSRKEGYPYKHINSTERRTVLARFGGVKIYRDSFRVRPYGDPSNDWLKLGARVSQSPAGAGQRVGDWRVRPESTAGIISISRISNPLLIDKSDRGALQENEAFDIFKKIVIGVISEFEYDRSKILNPFYLHNKTEKEKAKEKEINTRAEKLANEIIASRKMVEEKIYGKPSDIGLFQQKQEEEEKESYKKTFTDTFKTIDEENDKKNNEELVQIRALASLGLVVSSFTHELKSIKNNAGEIHDLEKFFHSLIPTHVKEKQNQTYVDCVDLFELLKENTELMQHWIDYSLTTIKKDKRKRKELDFAVFFTSLKSTWSKVFTKRKISFDVIDKTKSQNYIFRAFEMDMLTLFSNLINNSIDSFEQQKIIDERKIRITFSLNENNMEVLYSDNGAGIDSIFSDKDEIFLPFTTSKKDRKGNDIGTGLGMYLVKEVITEYAGNIEILDITSGFKVKIDLPTRRENNEI